MIETLRPIFARKPMYLMSIANITLQDTIITRSGREISMPPTIRATTNRILKNDIIKMSYWLVNETIQEALYRDDDFNLVSFRQMNPKRMSQADYDIINEYLFGVGDIAELLKGI